MSETFASTMVTHQQLLSVLDSVSDGICLIDRDFVVAGFNLAAEQLTGFSRSEAIGRRCCDVFQDCRKNSVNGCPAAAAFRTGQTVTDPGLRIRNRVGEDARLCFSVTALRSETEEIVGGVATFRSPSPTLDSPAHSEVTVDKPPPDPPETALPLLEASERRTIEAVLRRHSGNRAAASRELGISRTTLWRKMRKFRIQ